MDRIVIENVQPELEGSRFPIKRVTGEPLVVQADIFTEGAETVSAVLQYRRAEETDWREVPLRPMGDDRWQGEMTASMPGLYYYCVEAWLDPLRPETPGAEPLVSERTFSTRFARELPLLVDPARARFSAWYELFPRSCSDKPGRHGTFKDLENRLEDVAAMGFDIVYLPPIHPIGRTARKGKNNHLRAGPEDPGSPWAVGAAEGGHKSVHPQLGDLEGFRRLLSRARVLGLELALDIALQCSPDHPYVHEHPEWFQRAADGAFRSGVDDRNRYEDIIVFDFFNPDRVGLWEELLSIFEFWIAQGVVVFRVDNPHTKPFAFWEWLMTRLKTTHPELVFLSEGLTRPKLMHYLAKSGFSLAHDYFPWRNTKAELEGYYGWLMRGEPKEYFRPVLWTNTAQCLPFYLQDGTRAAFLTRLILAATLGASYGVYGPAFELCLAIPQEPGTESYRDSEQYEVRHWNWSDPGNLRAAIKRINHIRRENPALQSNESLQFHAVDNDQIIAYSKTSRNLSNVILTVVNLDTRGSQHGWVTLNLDRLGLAAARPFKVKDLFNSTCYWWEGPRNYVELRPELTQAHVFNIVKE